jgi:hypothetical protein
MARRRRRLSSESSPLPSSADTRFVRKLLHQHDGRFHALFIDRAGGRRRVAFRCLTHQLNEQRQPQCVGFQLGPRRRKIIAEQRSFAIVSVEESDEFFFCFQRQRGEVDPKSWTVGDAG